MFKPKFNKVLVEINDEEAKWGSGNDDSMLGASYREGKLMDLKNAILFRTRDYPVDPVEIIPMLEKMVGKTIMWHEGTEAGTVFEEDGKKYGLIYWWDVIAEKVSDAK